jgi:hypothetical protein
LEPGIITSITITATYGGISRAFKESLMAKPLVIPAAPVAKTGTITYNSTYAKAIDYYDRNTNKYVIQYGKLVTGMVELQIASATITARGDYILFTISDVSLPAAATPGVCHQLEDYQVYGMIMPAIMVNTNGTVTFNVRGNIVNGSTSLSISFSYISV